MTYTSSNKMLDILRETAAQTPNPKDSIREQQTSLPAKDIAQFAIQRLERRESQKIRRSYPTSQVEGLEITPNLPITGHDNGLVCCREKYLRVRVSAVLSMIKRQSTYSYRDCRNNIPQRCVLCLRSFFFIITSLLLWLDISIAGDSPRRRRKRIALLPEQRGRLCRISFWSHCRVCSESLSSFLLSLTYCYRPCHVKE